MAKYTKEQRPPPTKKIWDPPPLCTTCGDKSESITFEAVGRALSEWERFEGKLSLLFAAYIGGDKLSIPSAIRAYGAIQTFRGRSDIIESAADIFYKIFPNQKLENQYKKFMEMARGFSARRNEIAHGIVYTPIWPDGNKYSALFPSGYNIRKNKLDVEPFDINTIRRTRLSYAYTSKDINKFSSHFLYLSVEVEGIENLNSAWRAGRMRDLEKQTP